MQQPAQRIGGQPVLRVEPCERHAIKLREQVAGKSGLFGEIAGTQRRKRAGRAPECHLGRETPRKLMRAIAIHDRPQHRPRVVGSRFDRRIGGNCDHAR